MTDLIMTVENIELTLTFATLAPLLFAIAFIITALVLWAVQKKFGLVSVLLSVFALFALFLITPTTVQYQLNDNQTETLQSLEQEYGVKFINPAFAPDGLENSGDYLVKVPGLSGVRVGNLHSDVPGRITLTIQEDYPSETEIVPDITSSPEETN